MWSLSAKIQRTYQNCKKRYSDLCANFKTMTYGEVGTESRKFRLYYFESGKKKAMLPRLKKELQKHIPKMASYFIII